MARAKGSQLLAGTCRSGFGGVAASLAERVFFKSHLQNGQRVATE